MNYKKGQFLDKYKCYKCIVSDEKYAVFARITTHEGEETLDCDDILVYSNTLEEKIPTPIEKILTLESNKMNELVNFGEALEALKQGYRIQRKGWNGKEMFLFLLPASDNIPTKAIHDPKLKEVIEKEVGGDTFKALGSIRMFTADKKVLTGWLASQTDMLSEDWVILN